LARYLTSKLAADKRNLPPHGRPGGDRNRLAGARCRCYAL